MISVLALIMIVLTMFSRNYLGVHTPQDVIVGSGVSLLVVYLVHRLLEYADRREGKKDLLIAVCMILFTVLGTIYIQTKTYPMDYVNGVLLVNPEAMKPDTFQGIGFILGFAAAWYLERHYIRYSFEKVEKDRVITAIICALPVYHLFESDTVPFMAFGKRYAKLITGFILMFNCVAVVPAVLKKCDENKGFRRFVPALTYLLTMAFIFFVGFTGVRTGTMSRAKEQQQFEALLMDGKPVVPSMEEPVYVIGHRIPDSDTVCSAIAMADLLQKLGYNAEPRITGLINKETAFILESAGIPVPQILEDASGKQIYMVDHNETIQAVDGIENAVLVGITDHHRLGNASTSHPTVMETKTYGATATIIAKDYEVNGLTPEPAIASVILSGIMSDTGNLKNAHSGMDSYIYQKMLEISGISDPDAYYLEMRKIALSYDDMTDEEIYRHDMKDYKTDELTYSIGYIEVTGGEEALAEMSERMAKVMGDIFEEQGTDMLFAMVSEKEIDRMVLTPYGSLAYEAAAEAFRDMAEYDGRGFIFSPDVARKTVIVPALNKVIPTLSIPAEVPAAQN